MLSRVKRKSTRGITLLEMTIAVAIVIIAGGAIFWGVRASCACHRSLEAASARLQADIRYVQRRAINEGRQAGIVFEPAYNRYYLRLLNPDEVLRTVYFTDGVEFRTNFPATNNNVSFWPRGTATRAGTIFLYSGDYRQRVTFAGGGGTQLTVHEIEER